ncbi:TPA: chorismate synthase [Candidatus Sumerlaeota bacterium]|jgi:chorismate synthase|nr:chorismate synthase [Candidatus Sumerlaeota bacterium]
MSGSVWGELFRISTFGESHGKAVGVVVEGVSPNLPLCEEDVQKELDRRKPGQSDLTTPRQESDTVHILSGVFEGKATGAPIAMLVWNADQRPAAYDTIKDLFRPGHADFTFLKKYGIRDHRGSGRSSGRETAARVAAGAIAKKMLTEQGVAIHAGTIQVGSIRTDKRDWDVVEKNPVRCPDAEVAEKMADLIRQMASEKDSVGGIIECRIQGVPVGLGEPVFDKLDADLAKAMLSLGAVKGIEFGAGFSAVAMRGSQHNDAITPNGFVTNNAGGIVGGISNGDEIIFRIAVKPTSSIATPQQSIDVQGQPATVVTEGRHDPCICPRIIPVVEAMAALTLVDHWKRQMSIGLGAF